jgi:uncharacterized protein YqgC (DUF456 family)
VQLAQHDILYSTDGEPQCAACHAKADLVATDVRAAGNIVKAGWGAIGASLLGCFGQIALLGIISYFFVATAVISSVYALNSLSSSNEHFAKHLTDSQRSTTRLLAIVALVIAGLTIVGVPLRLFYRF